MNQPTIITWSGKFMRVAASGVEQWIFMSDAPRIKLTRVSE